MEATKMDCEYQKHIECATKKCSVCGWNPIVEKERKRKSREANGTNLVYRLRAHKEKAAKDAIRILASQVGGTVTVSTLQSICRGEAPDLEPGELLRIDTALRRIEGFRDG